MEKYKYREVKCEDCDGTGYTKCDCCDNEQANVCYWCNGMRVIIEKYTTLTPTDARKYLDTMEEIRQREYRIDKLQRELELKQKAEARRISNRQLAQSIGIDIQ